MSATKLDKAIKNTRAKIAQIEDSIDVLEEQHINLCQYKTNLQQRLAQLVHQKNKTTMNAELKLLDDIINGEFDGVLDDDES